MHPLGKAPVITDGDRTVAESGAIVEYLVEIHGNGRLRPPAGTEARLRYSYWLHYAEGSAMPPLLLKLIFQRLPKGPVPVLIRPVVRRIARGAQDRFIDPLLKTHIDYWESELGKHTYFTGDEFTAADIVMSFPLEIAAVRAPGGVGEKANAFIARIRARPAFRNALEVGGPFSVSF